MAAEQTGTEAASAASDPVQRIRDQFGFDPFDPEPLHPVLAPCVFEQDNFSVLKHPLVFDVPYMSAMNAVVNRRYVETLKCLEKAVVKADWGSYVFLHERPYRLDAFRDCQWFLDDDTYWTLLGDIWTDSENIWQSYDEWHEVLSSNRSGRTSMMTDEELVGLASLPEEFTIYRGYKHNWHEADNIAGFSWSLDRDRAEWFARRYLSPGDEPMLATACVRRDDVIAYFTGRQESEIVVLPDDLLDVQTEALDG